MKARLVGSYRVYCGAGAEHAISLDEKASVWNTEAATEDGSLVFAAFDHDDENAADELAGLLVSWALDDWSDLCDVEEEGEEVSKPPLGAEEGEVSEGQEGSEDASGTDSREKTEEVPARSFLRRRGSAYRRRGG